MNTRLIVILVVAVLSVASCGGDDDGVDPTTSTTVATSPPASGEILLDYDFRDGPEGWESGTSDYTPETAPEDVVAETGVAPPEFDAGDGFFHLAATNRSDDVFVFLKRRIGSQEGLAPDTIYEISYTVEFASDAPSGCAGVGGAPGESVWMKVGASAEEPVAVERNGDIQLSVDKGGQSQGGPAADVAGNVANGIPCEEALEQEPPPYAMVRHEHTFGGSVDAGAEAVLWLLVGTDSGFESRTSLYYDRITVTLTPLQTVPTTPAS